MRLRVGGPEGRMRGFRLVLGVGSWQSAVGSFADGCMTPHPAFGHPLPEGEGINILLPGEKVPAGRMRGIPLNRLIHRFLLPALRFLLPAPPFSLQFRSGA